VSDNVASTCNCLRQCRRLSYKHEISQAMLSNHLVKSARDTLSLNISLDKLRIDYCFLEVTLYCCVICMNTLMSVNVHYFEFRTL